MRILFVEDEMLIRLVISEELMDDGYEVIEAETGDDAVALIEAGRADCQLLITDINMPGNTDGIGVARHIRAKCPNMPVIYITGRPDAFHDMAPLTRREHILKKPFATRDLLEVVRSELHGHA